MYGGEAIRYARITDSAFYLAFEVQSDILLEKAKSINESPILKASTRISTGRLMIETTLQAYM